MVESYILQHYPIVTVPFFYPFVVIIPAIYQYITIYMHQHKREQRPRTPFHLSISDTLFIGRPTIRFVVDDIHVQQNESEKIPRTRFHWSISGTLLSGRP